MNVKEMTTDERFEYLENKHPMMVNLGSDLLPFANGSPLLHRVITMAYEAGRRDAARQFVGAATSAAFMCGFDLAEGGELRARFTEGLLK